MGFETDWSWEHIETLAAVTEAGSFSAAARALGVGQPTVSRRIAHLEDRTGTALFRRTREGVVPTSATEALLPAMRRMGDWAAEFGRVLAGQDAQPRGVVKITAPPGVAFDLLAPLAVTVRERYPAIRLQVLSGVEYLDLSRGDADIAIRTRKPTQRDLVTLFTSEMTLGAYGSSGYAEGLKKPCGLADLDWISWAPPLEHIQPGPFLESAIPGFAPSFASDSFLVQCRAAQAGMGALILPEDQARRYGLVKLEVPLPVFPAHWYLVCAKSAQNIPRVRAITDMLIEEAGRL